MAGVEEEAAVCAMIITCSKVGSQWEKHSHSLQTCACESYTVGCCVFTAQHLKKAVNADRKKTEYSKGQE